MTHEGRIARYKAAYEAANGKPLVERLVYERGWYLFGSTWRVERRCRAAKLDEMIVRLEWRASEDGRSFFEFAAQAIETRRAETREARFGAKHESAVPNGDAP